MQEQVVIYTLTGCRHCLQAKQLLSSRGHPYLEVNIDDVPSLREDLIRRTGKRTLPQVFFKNTHIGGKDELQALLSVPSKWTQFLKGFTFSSNGGEDALQLVDLSHSNLPLYKEDNVYEDSEKDDLFELSCEIETSRLTSRRCNRLACFSRRSTYRGKDLVKWLHQEKGIDKQEASQLSQQLLDRRFLVSSSQKNKFKERYFYRSLKNAYPKAINSGPSSNIKPRSASCLGEDMRRLLLRLYAAHLSPDGKEVDYTSLRNSKEFQAYISLTKELQRVRLDGMSREGTLAFFINVYNALVVHAIIEWGAPKNFLKKLWFFSNASYVIGGWLFSLEDMEHGILRGNAARLPLPALRHFHKKDPRRAFALTRPEPLVHFALVWGCRGSPTINSYTEQNINQELHLAAESFLEDDTKLKVEDGGKVHLSRIFQWYQTDFGPTPLHILEWIHRHLPEGEKKRRLAAVIENPRRKICYLPYDWSLNSV